jgi:Mg-chelatase subunit ChlD
MSITEQASGLYNLPTNTEVKFYLSPDYATPFTTANSGAPWGGVGVPASPYDVCNGGAVIAPAPVPGTVQGTKFQDTNNNGVQDSGEPGLPGWTIEIRDSAGNLTSLVTDDAGNYQTTLFAGDYTISEVQQDGWTQISPASGSHTVSIQAGSSTTDVDFGNHYENSCSVPLDIVFVIDVTGSMGDAIDGVKGELDRMLNDISGTSGGDYQLGLVTFSDDVFVLNDLQANNLSAVKANISLLTANGGNNVPEASDEALNTVINGLAARDNQTGNFTNAWRPNARKHIILVTNAVPGGFDDAYSDADKTNAEALAQAAQNSGIKIDAIQVPGDEEAVMIMQNYADVSGGTYVLTNESGSNAASEILNIITECSTEGTLQGQVTDAVSGNPIAGAEVCVQGTSQCAMTDGSGNYVIADVPAGDHLLNVTADGYISVDDQSVTVTAGETTTQPIAMSPELAAGELRIVLTWGENPSDLDSYLWLPNSAYINYSQPGDPNTANLDLDDTSGNGPETITIAQREDGTYTYAVNNFSGNGFATLSTSGAVVRVYQGDREINSFPVPTTGDGLWWHVFDIDGATGTITPVNTLSDTQPR